MSELLRFATAGSVDDGKSTLIGRLLYDSKQIFEDQYEAVERVSLARGDEYVNVREAASHFVKNSRPFCAIFSVTVFTPSTLLASASSILS